MSKHILTCRFNPTPRGGRKISHFGYSGLRQFSHRKQLEVCASKTFDYVIVGGGTAGLTVAHRLSKTLKKSSILVVEAGGDPRSNPDTASFSKLARSRDPGFKENWSYDVAPNKRFEKSTAQVAAAGKGLGGSTSINAGVWFRGNEADFDVIARLAGDGAWSYRNMLPYVKMVEKAQGLRQDDDIRGNDGYVNVTQVEDGSERKPMPLRDDLKSAWDEAGFGFIGDPNRGYQNGLANFSECWSKGKRQYPLDVFDLTGVQTMTHTQVHKILFEDSGSGAVASGLQLADGTQVYSSKEVIVCAGAYQSPKLLMLSGIGPRLELKKHGVSTLIDNAEVGQNLVDHFGVPVTWKLRHPERGLALGSPAFSDPSYLHGWPADFIFHSQVKEPAGVAALIPSEKDRSIILRPGGSNIEIWQMYVPMGKSLTGVDVPVDGSYTTTISLVVSPLSRGQVRLNSSNPDDMPFIDRNALSEDADMYIHREALRTLLKVYQGTSCGQQLFEGSVNLEGLPPLNLDSSDEDLDARIRVAARSINHPAGTCSLGKVVDGRARVKNVRGLRVVDASILPTGHGCPIQPLVYAAAERVAAFIVEDHK